MDRKYHRSTTHQALRDLLASMVSDFKRDRQYLSADHKNLTYDLGYMSALAYAIRVDVDNTMNFGRVHDLMKKDCEQADRVLERMHIKSWRLS